MTILPLDAINIEGGTQPRANLDTTAVADYAELLRDGTELPPVTAFYDGTSYWLADGFHRWWAHAKAERAEIEVDVRQGTQRDAVLYSVGANASHGMRRTNADKRRGVKRLLEDHEWRSWSNAEIARRCRVGDDLVAELRRETPARDTFGNESQRTYTHPRSGQPTQMNVTNIGRPTAYGSPPAPMRREQDRVRYNDDAIDPAVAAQKRFISIRTSMREMPDAKTTVECLAEITVSPDAVADAERCSDWWGNVAEAMQDRLDRQERVA